MTVAAQGDIELHVDDVLERLVGATVAVLRAEALEGLEHVTHRVSSGEKMLLYLCAARMTEWGRCSPSACIGPITHLLCDEEHGARLPCR